MSTGQMSKTKKIISKDVIDKINSSPRKFADEQTVQSLVKILKALSDVYYNTGESLVSDEIYDVLKDVLSEKDPNNSFLVEVGAPVEKNKVKLPYPMGSLDKIKPDKNNLDNWVKRFPGPYIISDKLDGTSAQLYKVSSSDSKLYSRGDGIEGQDISHLIKFLVKPAVLNKIPVGMSIRGEIIISKSDFKKISDKMKNARNASSGVVNSKTVDTSIAKLCQFVAYSILYPVYKADTQMEMLKEYGFKTAEYKIVKSLSYDMLSEYLKDRREHGDFEVDGIVVFDCSKPYNLEAGNPEYGFAFKTILQDQIGQTVVKEVIWSPSKHGYLKPTIEMEPIDVGGVTIVHATAFNAKYVSDNKLGPGAVVKIIRSGDVIPYILEVVEMAAEPQMPDIPYKWNDTGVDILLKDLYGAQKDVVVTKQITSFFKTLGVDFIGEGIVTKLVDAGYKSVHDIIKALKDDPSSLENIDGIGSKMVNKIWNNFDAAIKKTNLYTLMAASAVFDVGLGVRKIKLIIDTFPDIMDKKWSTETLSTKIQEIKGFSTITADKFAKGFKDFKEFFNKLNDVVDISYLKEVPEEAEVEEIEEEPGQDTVKGLTIVFTGFRDKELEQKIVAKGGKVSTSVSGKTSIVVRADGPLERTGKILEAEKHKVSIMTKTEFTNKYKLLI